MTNPDQTWPELPTETEIYILPNGEIVIADMPAELVASLAEVIRSQPGAGENDDPVNPVSPQTRCAGDSLRVQS